MPSSNRFVRALDRQRQGEYGAVSLKVLTGRQIPYSEQASYADGWYLKHPEHVPQGADYFTLYVFDSDGTRAVKLTTASAFAISGQVYQRKAGDPPKGTFLLWEFKLQPTGQRI